MVYSTIERSFNFYIFLGALYMRVKLTFHSEEPLVIPVQYDYAIQSMLYDNISRNCRFSAL